MPVTLFAKTIIYLLASERTNNLVQTIKLHIFQIQHWKRPVQMEFSAWEMPTAVEFSSQRAPSELEEQKISQMISNTYLRFKLSCTKLK